MKEQIELPNSELQQLFQDIDLIIKTSNTTYLDAIIHWCYQKNIDVEYVTSVLVANNISIAKLQCDAESLNFLKKQVRIPV